jgi:chromate transporter
VLDNRLLGLVLVFAPLSLLSFGGGQAIVPEIQHQTVVVQGWLTDRQFSDLFAISRAAPGPSTLIAALIGWQVHGLLGAVVATLAIYLPSSIVVYAAGSWWQRNEASPLRKAIERGLAPVAVGLIFAGAVTVLRAAHAGVLELITTAAVTALLHFTKISTYAMVILVAAVYLLLHFFLAAVGA